MIKKTKKTLELLSLFLLISSTGIFQYSHTMNPQKELAQQAYIWTTDRKYSFINLLPALLTGNISNTILISSLDYLFQNIANLWIPHKVPGHLQFIDYSLGMSDFITSYNKLCQKSLDLRIDSLAVFQQRFTNANLTTLLENEVALTDDIKEAWTFSLSMSKDFCTCMQQCGIPKCNQRYLLTNPDQLVSFLNCPKQGLLSENQKKNLLSYNLARIMHQNYIDRLQEKLNSLRTSKRNLIQRENTAFLQNLPTDKTSLMELKDYLNTKISIIRDNEKRLKECLGLCNQNISRLIGSRDKRRLNQLSFLKIDQNKLQRAISEAKEELAKITAQKEEVSYRIEEISRQQAQQASSALQDFIIPGLSLDEKVFAQKHGLLPREGMDVLPEQTDIIKALYQGHEKNQEALICNIKNINQLAELKSDCIDTCPQAVEYYDSATTFTFGAIEAYRQNNTKDATLLDSCANALCMMGNATVKTAQCVSSFTKSGAATISENVIGTLNIPQLLQNLGVAGRELFSFIVINGIEENCMRHSMWTEARAKIAESIGCSQETVDNLREAAAMQSQASQLFAKSTIDMLVEHPEILQNLSRELATEFVNAPLEKQFEIAGCLGGHIASFWTTPYALGKIVQGGSFATQWGTQIARESETFKSLLLSLQLLYKVETSKMVQFGGKIMSEQVAYALSSLRKTAGPAFAAMTDKQLVHAVFKEISPCTSELERLISNRFPELVVGVNKVEQAAVTAVEGVRATQIMNKLERGLALTENEVRDLIKMSPEHAKNLEQLDQIVDKLNKTTQDIRYGLIEYSDIDHIKYLKLLEQTEKRYEMLRSGQIDVTKIAKNTGIPEDIIKQIKDHIFYAKHNLSRGIEMRFDASINISDAWQRLVEGKFVQSDLRLLLHEYTELVIMSNKGNLNSRFVHDIANKIHNWERFA